MSEAGAEGLPPSGSRRPVSPTTRTEPQQVSGGPRDDRTRAFLSTVL